MKNTKKELEDRILDFSKGCVRRRIERAIKELPHLRNVEDSDHFLIDVSIRDTYLAVGADEFGDASIFNQVLAAMHRANIIRLAHSADRPTHFYLANDLTNDIRFELSEKEPAEC